MTSADGQRFGQRYDDRWVGRFVLSADGRIVEASPSLNTILGLPVSVRLVGHELDTYCPDAAALERLFGTVRAVGRASVADLSLLRPDGETIRVALALEAVFDPGGRPTSMRGVTFEVSESVEARQRLFGTERMEALGRLAGGIAHEFNNLLMVMSGHGERLVGALDPDTPPGRSAAAILSAARRASMLTQQLLAFGRRQVFQPRVVDLGTLIADVRPLIVGALGERVDLRLAVPEQLAPVRVDPAQVSQALVHLAAYAREAMPEGGTLSLQADLLSSGPRDPRERPWVRPGTYVRVVVSDTGPGLDAEAQAHLFEPFFSARREGVASGLGLASVYGIVKQSGGFIWVESEAGRGTTFTILLPMHGAAEGAATAVATGDRPVDETVLVVEDDEEVRALITDQLRHRGYRVLESASGEQAHQVFAGAEGRVHLLLTSVALQSDTGPALARRLQAIDPRLRVLYLSELPVGTTVEEHEVAAAPFIQKPFSLQALVDKVRAVLEADRG